MSQCRLNGIEVRAAGKDQDISCISVNCLPPCKRRDLHVVRGYVDTLQPKDGPRNLY